jgi:thiamine biosynthesis protein ThiS
MTVILNGEPHQAPQGATVASLLQGLGLDARKVAVERNREIVPKSQYDETPLAEGDALEIVHFIGGGSQ